MGEHQGARCSWGGSSVDSGGHGSLEASPYPSRSPCPPHSSPSRLPSLHLPAYVRRKLTKGQGNGGRVGSTEGGGQRPHAFGHKDPCRDPHLKGGPPDPRWRNGGDPGDPGGGPYGSPRDPLDYRDDPCKDPLVDPIRDPLRSSIRDLGGYGTHHPVETPGPPRCYLDLFDPSVPVIRDPVLDRPSTSRPPFFKGVPRKLAVPLPPCVRTWGCCCVLLLVVVTIVVTVVMVVRRGGRGGPEDPRFDPPFVTTVTGCGLVRGRMVAEHLEFWGVPYAVPPTGPHRFLPSRPPSHHRHCWTGTYTATTATATSTRCWHYDAVGNTVEGTEDCLTLDVFTPQLGYDSPLPVVVYVGGASMGGDLHRPLLLSAFGSFSSKRRMVVVSPNIRRGALGVMPHPGIAEAVYPPTAGGQAASDLTAALQWVARNIEHFGGDPSSVTLLGHRAGAGLVYPILGSPKTRDLVHRAWLSGAPPLYPVNPWRESGVDFLRPSNCSRLDCLSRLTARQIMDAPVEALRRPDVGRPWLVADGVYISFVPSVPTVPLMIGTPVHSAAPSLLSARRPVSRSSQPSASVPHPLDVVTRVVSQVLSDALVFASNASLLQDDLYFNRFPPDSPWYRPPPPLPHFPLDEARRLVHLYSDVITDPWLLLVTMVSDAMFVCPTLSLSSHLSQATTLPPHVARSPHHLPQHLHIIASGRHPAALHQSTFSVYSYLSTHRRRSMLGNLADPDSDIDAIFGIFHKTNDKFPGNEFPEDDQTNAEEISDAGLESTDKDASNEFYWSGNTGLNSEAMPYSDVQKFARYSSTKDSPNYSDTQNFPSYSGTQVSPGYREKERLFDDALTDVNIDYNSVDSNHFRRSINHTDDMRSEINDEGSKLQMPVNEGNNYLDDDGKRTLPRHDKGNIRRSSDAITTSRNAPEETAAKGNTVSEKGFKENGVVEDARTDTKRSARHSEDKNSGLSKEDQSYVEKMQELFTLFVELGKPERYFPTPGHVGTYMVGANVTIEKRKQFCIFWEKWKNLAKRY